MGRIERGGGNGGEPARGPPGGDALVMGGASAHYELTHFYLMALNRKVICAIETWLAIMVMRQPLSNRFRMQRRAMERKRDGSLQSAISDLMLNSASQCPLSSGRFSRYFARKKEPEMRFFESDLSRLKKPCP